MCLTDQQGLPETESSTPTAGLSWNDAPDWAVSLINDISRCLAREGWSPDHECISVARSAVRFLGLPYGRSEELRDDCIDCSTLTSQSHWEGAVVGIPFLAENQRKAVSATAITLEARIIPGDVAVKFRTLGDTSDNHNHVAIVVGRDSQSRVWLLESCAGFGTRLVSLDDFAPAGGVRRFLPFPTIPFRTSGASAALALARRVPKLGRFYAGQHTVHGWRSRHLGIDIYSPVGAPVFAPIRGKVTLGTLPSEDGPLLTIVDESTDACCTLGQVIPAGGIMDGAYVTAGEHVGSIVEPSSSSEVRYVRQPDGTTSHLHLAFARDEINLGNSVTFNGRVHHNALYACKLGLLRDPLRLEKRCCFQ